MALKDISDSKLLKLLRFVPIGIISLNLLVLANLLINFWILEVYISGLPQILIFNFGLVVLLLTLYLYFIIKFSWTKCVEIVGRGDLLIVIAAITLSAASFIYLLSSNQVTELSDKSGYSVKIGTFNKLYSNDNVVSGINYFINQEADIVGLQEISPEEVELFRKGLGEYHSFVTDCDCSAQDTEVALVSRFPITDSSTVYEFKNGAVIRVELASDASSKIIVYVAHITPPFSNSWYQRRNAAYSAMINSISRETDPVFVVGDFNTTVFSPGFQNLKDATSDQIQYTSLRKIPKCSWFGLGDAVCLRIDHIFIPKKINLRDLQIGNNVGSDHRPVLAEVVF